MMLDRSPLGLPIPHESALGHVTGAARYIDDLPEPHGLLHAMELGSPHAHARIIRSEAGEALGVPGVHAVLFARHIRGENNAGPIVHDEPVLADGEVHCVGQPVAVVIAESREACREALARIEIDYEPLPAICDLQSGIEARHFLGTPHQILRGDPDEAIDAAPHRLEGTVDSGGQEHFYLETHCAVAHPGEADTIRVLSSTQHPSEVQALVAGALGWGRHRVVVECPRMGGAFGGKESQAARFAVLAALGAVRTGRSVKCWLDRDTDMHTTGRRHPFHTRWRVGFDDTGRILGLDAEVYNDGGWATDLSVSINDRALFTLDNAYHLEQVRLLGRVVRTNRTSNTAFRGFGGPQGMVVIEHILERIAAALGLDPLEVRRRNLYGEATGWHTPYGQRVDHFHLPQMIDDLAQQAGLAERREEVARFNMAHRWRKRSLALVPVKFGISFTASFLNQAGALLMLYEDGTVQLNHGGTEMGQGLYTKMMQVCAHALGTDLSRVRHMTTATDKVPNTSATAASSGADLNGQAVRLSAEALVARLKPVAADMLGVPPEAVRWAAGCHVERPLVGDQAAWAWVEGGKAVSLSQVAREARLRRIQLSEAGFYRTPEIGYDRARGQGRPFYYFAYGAALSEVEVDGLTGEWRLRRVDILHDVGESLSSDVDRGQIEGGFVQGLGWLTMEELIYDDQGSLISHSPSTYKIPAVGDAPITWHVRTLPRTPQPGVIYGSKAVGEPPFLLAVSAWVAICRAVSAFADGDIVVPIPATTEAILMSLEAEADG